MSTTSQVLNSPATLNAPPLPVALGTPILLQCAPHSDPTRVLALLPPSFLCLLSRCSDHLQIAHFSPCPSPHVPFFVPKPPFYQVSRPPAIWVRLLVPLPSQPLSLMVSLHICGPGDLLGGLGTGTEGGPVAGSCLGTLGPICLRPPPSALATGFVFRKHTDQGGRGEMSEQAAGSPACTSLPQLCPRPRVTFKRR